MAVNTCPEKVLTLPATEVKFQVTIWSSNTGSEPCSGNQHPGQAAAGSTLTPNSAVVASVRVFMRFTKRIAERIGASN